MGEATSILVVDDDPAIRDLHRLWLADDHEVVTAPDGEAALGCECPVDVVLLDRNLPGMNGDGVARELRSEGFQGTIVMVTADRPDPTIATLPIDDYVNKPVGQDDLLALLERYRARSTVPDVVKELFGMVSRRARLEATFAQPRLSDSDAYRKLLRHIDTHVPRAIDRVGTRRRLMDLADRTLPDAVDFEAAITPEGSSKPRKVSPGAGQEI